MIAWDAGRYQTRHSYVYAYGESLIVLLEAQAGEKILDLGCGSGQLTARIAETGAEVMGVDRSPEMVAEARANFPSLRFEIADAANFDFENRFDAIFSNAVLHWVKDAEGSVRSMARSLRVGGRMVVEMGGKGNVREVIAAVREVAGPVEIPWAFHSVAEYTTLLERHGFEIGLATLFDRPTAVAGEDGLDDWLMMFAGPMLDRFGDRAPQMRREVADILRPKLYRDGAWMLDYRRLRVIAKCNQ
jgi:trans-aconitate 2-methyltransferase